MLTSKDLIAALLALVAAAQDLQAAEMTAQLVDADWDGVTIPRAHVCKLAGAASPVSPRIQVGDIPLGATKIVVAFNDESYPKLATDGGHGKISVAVNARTVTVPSVPSESDSIPDGVKVEAKHRSTTPGYYLAPCSRGQGHTYAAEVLAVKSGWFGSSVVGRVRLLLGSY
jgi:hypothetical protein